MSDIKVYEPGQILKTTDYSMFKKLLGNRSVDVARQKKIRASIINYGYITCPIVVNENMEVIDGQGRLTVLEDLELPVYYMVIPGLGFDDCIAMNTTAGIWKLIDYIKAYATNGNDNYRRLLRLVEEYSEVTQTNVLCASTGRMTSNDERIKSGQIEISLDQYLKARELLDYVIRFVPMLDGIGDKNTLINSLMFAYQCAEVDPEKLYKQFVNYSHKMNGFGDTVSCLDALSEVYNFKSRGDRVYLDAEYKKAMNERYPWYEHKWGGRSRDDKE